MRYNIRAQSYFLEIDFSNLIRTVRSLQSDIHYMSNTIKTERDARQNAENCNMQITWSNIRIYAKKHINSLSSFVIHGRLIERPTGIYLIFSIQDDNGKSYHYNIFIMKRVCHVRNRKMLFLESFKIILDDEYLQSDMIQKSLYYWVRNFRTTSNFRINIWWLITTIVALVFIFNTTGISTSFANFF